MSEDYKLQVSLKFGPGLIGMLNIRANTPPELEELIGAAEEMTVGKLAGLTETISALSNIQTAFAGAQVVSGGGGNAPQAQGPTGQNCAHGPMTYRTGGSGNDRWEGYFCPLQKTDPNRCKPVYPK